MKTYYKAVRDYGGEPNIWCWDDVEHRGTWYNSNGKRSSESKLSPRVFMHKFNGTQCWPTWGEHAHLQLQEGL